MTTQLRNSAHALAAAALILATGCTGDVGPTGPAGSPGTDGSDGADAPATTQTITGTVSMPSGASASVIVQAYLLDLDGRAVAQVGAAVGDGAGAFSLDVPVGLPLGTQLLLMANGAANEALSAFALASSTDIDAATHGVSELVRAIVSSPGGVALTQFDGAALASIVTDARTALETAGTDLTDAAAVENEVKSSVGTDVAAVSGAQITAGAPQPAVTMDPPGVDAPQPSFNFSLFDGSGEEWDVTADGSISEGSTDAYDDFFDLFLDSIQFTADTSVVRDDRTVVFDSTNFGALGLDVTRKVYVSPDMAWVRWTEVLSNPTGSDVTVQVQIEGNLGSDESTELAHATSSGDDAVGPGDEWLTSHWDLSDPALGFLFPGATNVTKDGDDIDYYWDDVVVPAGDSVTIFHFGFQRSAASVEDLTFEVNAIGTAPGADFYADVTILDASNGWNGGLLASVSGGPGAAVPGETLTVLNDTQSFGISVTAGPDGRFSAPIAVTSGDEIEIDGSFGTSVTLIVP